MATKMPHSKRSCYQHGCWFTLADPADRCSKIELTVQSNTLLGGHKYYGILRAAVTTMVVVISDFFGGEFSPFGDKLFRKKKEIFVYIL
jgi:hypothetical protein